MPFWAKDVKVGYKTINARAETVDEKPSFRNAFKRRRRLIPADGFYEWKKLDDGGKQPYRLCLADRGPFSVAGLWESNKDLDSTSRTIVVTEPNTVAAEIHDRVPGILHQEDYGTWRRLTPSRMNLRSRFDRKGVIEYLARARRLCAGRRSQEAAHSATGQ